MLASTGNSSKTNCSVDSGLKTEKIITNTTSYIRTFTLFVPKDFFGIKINLKLPSFE